MPSENSVDLLQALYIQKELRFRYVDFMLIS